MRLTQTEAAAIFGWDKTAMSRMLSGRITPTLETAIRIERRTGIPVEAWLDETDDCAAEAATSSTA